MENNRLVIRLLLLVSERIRETDFPKNYGAIIQGGKTMCFRPPAAGKPKKCPQCGTLNPPVAKECKKCKALLVEDKKEDKKDT
jgi:ribosomal protein L40E